MLEGRRKQERLLSWCETSAELKRGRGGKIDVVSCAELLGTVNDKFLNQVGAVSDARDQRCARDQDLDRAGAAG